MSCWARVLYSAISWAALLFAGPWYRLSQWFGRRYDVEVQEFSRIEDIVRLMKWGSLYKEDPLRGMLDVMRHPRAIQKRLDDEGFIGDCDDHVAYLLAALSKSKLAGKLYAAFLYGYTEGGGRFGHAICVFRNRGEWYWMDYGMPRKVDGQWGWAKDCAEMFGVRCVTGGVLLEFAGLTKHESVKLKRVGVLPRKYLG